MNGGGDKDYLGGPSASDNDSVPEAKSSPKGEGDRASGRGDPCDIRGTGVLRSPDPAVVTKLAVGDDVRIGVVTVNGVEVLTVDNAKGIRIGVLDIPSEGEIIACTKQGNDYGGKIAKKQGGAVSVSVQRTSTK